MKSAYELAMERLNKTSPTAKLTNEQKKKLAALDAEYKAKFADREIDRKSTRLNSSHLKLSRMPSSA